jgi:hypothetical protein
MQAPALLQHDLLDGLGELGGHQAGDIDARGNLQAREAIQPRTIP